MADLTPEQEEQLKVAQVTHKLNDRVYVTGTGQHLKPTHEPTKDCFRRGCSIHNPTDPHPDWPNRWNGGVMERQCGCGNWHVDKDDFNYRMSRYEEASALANHAPDTHDRLMRAWIADLQPHECTCTCHCCWRYSE